MMSGDGLTLGDMLFECFNEPGLLPSKWQNRRLAMKMVKQTILLIAPFL